MNALYLGPYRQSNDEGVQSRIYLNTLSESINVCSRTVYTDPLCVDNDCNYDITERIEFKNINLLVQHLPISQLAIYKKIKYNVCIPIVNSRNLSDDDFKKLEYFDSILVDNDYLYNKISSKFYHKIKLIKSNIIQNKLSVDNKFNLNNRELSHKFYFIGDYKNNIDLINDISIAFIRLNKEYADIILIFFLYNTEQSEIVDLTNNIKRAHQLFQIKNNIINIIPIPISNNISSLISAHNSGNTFLNIADSSKIPINKTIAINHKNKIIDISDNLYVFPIRNNIYFKEQFSYPNNEQIYTYMKNSLNGLDTENKKLNYEPLIGKNLL